MLNRTFRFAAASGVALIIGWAGSAQSEPIVWLDSYADAVAQAREADKPLFIDFYADWCGPCRQMDADVYGQADVAGEMADFVAVKVDVDKHVDVAAAYQVNSIPRFIVISTHDEIVGDMTGYIKKDYFLSLLDGMRPDLRRETGGTSAPAVASAGPSAEERVIAAAASKDLESWFTLLGDPDPNVRSAASDDLVARGSLGSSILVEALANDYLGTRIGAFEALKEHITDNRAFNPWADPAVRNESLGPWRDWAQEQLASTFDPEELTAVHNRVVEASRLPKTSEPTEAMDNNGDSKPDLWLYEFDGLFWMEGDDDFDGNADRAKAHFRMNDNVMYEAVLKPEKDGFVIVEERLLYQPIGIAASW